MKATEDSKSKVRKTQSSTSEDASSVGSVIKRKSKKTKLIRPRGKRGGVKNRKSSDNTSTTEKNKSKNIKNNGNPGGKNDSSASTSSHTTRIAHYHALEKELHAPSTTEERRAEILLEQESMGGIDAYQNDSVFGGDKLRGGESGKWLVGALENVRGIKKENVCV